MRAALIVILYVAALLAGVFACWGLFTAAGGRRFDEMDGMVPFFAGCGAGVALVVAVMIQWIHRRNR